MNPVKNSQNRLVVACSCEGTMPLDEGTLARSCGGTLRTASHLCRHQIDFAKALMTDGRPITIGCTQEAPLFTEIAEELDAADRVVFANIRENAGWSEDGRRAGPKMAALLAAAAEPTPPIQLVTLTSSGVALVYGRDETAIEAARRLSDHLDVTVLLTRPGDVTPPRATDFPILKGTVTGTLKEIDPNLAITLDQGFFSGDAVDPPLTGIALRAQVRDGALEIEKLSADWGPAAVQATGEIPFALLPADLPFTMPRRQGPAKLTAELVDLELGAFSEAPENLSGTISARRARLRTRISASFATMRASHVLSFASARKPPIARYACRYASCNASSASASSRRIARAVRNRARLCLRISASNAARSPAATRAASSESGASAARPAGCRA